MIWDAEAISRLRELDALGLNSARIAETLGLSRNSVHGARFRHGMARPRDPLPPRPEPPEEPFPDQHQCRWIHDNGPWRGGRRPQWCMAATVDGSPYCPQHRARCYSGR